MNAVAESSPYYFGTSLGLNHVSNLYRTASAGDSDTVTSLGLLGGLDQQIGRQRLTVDGSLQNNRYASNSNLNNSSYSLHSGLDWQTVGRLSGSLNVTSSRALADYNIGNGITPIFDKNTQRDNEYSAVARLGVATRYTVEAGFTRRTHDFSAVQYAQLAYRQNAGSLGLYAMPGGNLRVGLALRHTEGQNPTYPTGLTFNPTIPAFEVVYSPNDYRRNDVDLTLNWNTGGASTLNARISASRTNNSLSQLNDFSGTTGALGWTWQALNKLQLSAQFARDSGQETQVRASDVNRVYTSWQFGALYAMTGKLSLNASLNGSRSTKANDANTPIADNYELNHSQTLGLRWAYSRSFNMGCQYNRASRNASVAQYSYSANSFGCTGQAIFY
ncbi:MAG: hypothetical protein DI603_05200 [Roseateles depolymerans]|uniref:Uncharacterized protein n=1 Tax=Roseateles depolymerans TaxID=76731 RepID=A0A2W5DUL4_9BURK|nr:MAG: hypothetical protein DI603_05200 [Roseateles depolymerans]